MPPSTAAAAASWALPSLRVLATYAAVALAAIVLYEIVRSRVKGWTVRRLRRSAEAFIRKHDIRVDRFKLSNEAYVKAELLNDRELHGDMVAYAEERNLLLEHVRADVEKYIEEIVPFFSYIAYYRLARPVARFVLNMVYRVVVDHESIRIAQKKIPDDAVAVYMMNHRSNFDYVLAAHMLIHEIALSYAVGEWARVWPLESIFKSFGSYFIRRGFRDPLYHAVLRKYVQLISLRGVTQGFFPEGRLTRDGAMKEPKVGLLDYIVTILSQEGFRSDVVLVPVGLNFDQVVEDQALVGEALRGKEAPPGVREKILSLLRLVVLGPFTLAYNLGRVLLGGLKRHGYASASLGEPLSVRGWLAERRAAGEDVLALPPAERKARVAELAAQLMQRIGRAVPVTPVPLVATALLDAGAAGGPVARETVVRRVRALSEIARQRGAPLLQGQEFSETARQRGELDRARDEGARRPELLDVEEHIVTHDEAATTAKLGLEILVRRGLVASTGRGEAQRLSVTGEMEPYVRYYANSIKQHFEAPAAAPVAVKAG